MYFFIQRVTPIPQSFFSFWLFFGHGKNEKTLVCFAVIRCSEDAAFSIGVIVTRRKPSICLESTAKSLLSLL